MKIVFESCHFSTRWPCCICGGHTEKHGLYAMAKNDDGSEWGFVCEECIEAGADGMKKRAQKNADEAFERAKAAAHNAALLGVKDFDCPTMADWDSAERKHEERVYGPESLDAAVAELDALNKRVQELESWVHEMIGSPEAQAADGVEGGEA